MYNPGRASLIFPYNIYFNLFFLHIGSRVRKSQVAKLSHRLIAINLMGMDAQIAAIETLIDDNSL